MPKHKKFENHPLLERMSFTVLISEVCILLRAWILCGDGARVPPLCQTQPRISTEDGNRKVFDGDKKQF